MKFLIRRTTAVLAGSLLFSPAFGDQIPEWVNSYSVDNSCYCAPNIDTSLSKKITPTPVGGKSIHQICERIGQGPELTFENGEFNHPTYTDAQCGNGPSAHSVASQEDCEGRLTDDDIICMGVGPEWDLKSAFARKPKTAPSSSDVSPVAEADNRSNAAAIVTTPEASVAPRATVVDTPVLAPVQTAEKVLDNDTVDMPKATVIAERVVPERAPVIESAAPSAPTTADSLPLATVVDSQPVSPQPIPVSTDDVVTNTLPVESKDQTQLVEKQSVVESKVAAATDASPEPATVPAPPITSVQVQPRAQTKRIEIEPTTGEPEVADVTETTEVEKPVIAQVDAQSDEKVEATEVVSANTNSETQAPTVNTGLRVGPVIEGPGVRFKYVQLAPVGFDFGGNGAALEASVGKRRGWGLVGRAAFVEEYSEVMLGAAYSIVPSALNGATMTLMLGGESGTFDLGVTDYSDSGVVASAMLGYDFNSRIQAQSGVSYSTFFDGDPSLIGLLLMHLTPALDIAARVEMGDNDNASVGLRFHY